MINAFIGFSFILRKCMIQNAKYYICYLDRCTEHFSNQVKDDQQMLKGVVSSFFNHAQ
jgi:hypothetical protein